MTLEEFEERFGITEVDSDPDDSSYYRPENPAEVARNRKITDDFLNSNK